VRKAAASTAIAKAVHANRSRLFLRAATGAGRPTTEPPSAIHWSCSLTSCAVCHRSSGSLARQDWITRSKAGGVIGWIDETGCGFSCMMAPIKLA
jgi:cytochrome c553